MRASFEYLGILIPAGMSLLLFAALQSMIQSDGLGTGIALLLTWGGMGLASLFWLGAMISVLLRPGHQAQRGENSGLPGLITYLGLLSTLPAVAALVARYAVLDWDPFRLHDFNWPFLAWLGAVSGVQLLLGGLALSRR